MYFYSQRTVCVAVCETGSAVYDSANSSAAVQSVHGSLAGPKHRTGLYTLQHPLARNATLQLAPRHSAAPVRMAAKGKTFKHVQYVCKATMMRRPLITGYRQYIQYQIYNFSPYNSVLIHFLCCNCLIR